MYRKFCFAFAGISILIMLLISAFNILIDPYDMWGGGKIVGFNVYSSKAESVDRMLKPVAFLQKKVKPEAVFIGTSKCLYSIDAEVYQELSGKEAYNFSIRGASIYEMRRILEHVLYTDGNLKDVYIGITFAEFIDGRHYPLVREEKSFEDNEGQYGKGYIIPQNIIRNILSWETLKESINKVVDNYVNKYTYPFYMESGKVYDESLLGYFKLNQWHFNRTSVMMGRNGNYQGAQLNQEAFNELRLMIDLCKEKGVNYHVFISPVHALQMELFAAEWPVYEDWKRALVEIAPIMDFTDYNEMTTSEAKPGIIDDTTNPYFWDVMHMKPGVANLVMARLLGKDGVPADFGVLLTPENIEGYLETLRIGRENWEKGHPELVEEIRYCRGFSSVKPQVLSHTSAIFGKSLIAPAYAGYEVQVTSSDWLAHPVKFDKDTPLKITLSDLDRLYVSGTRLTRLGMLKAIYGILEDENGVRYYALVEQIDSHNASDFMKNHSYDTDGFSLKMPMWDVPPGDYRLSFAEVSTDGQIYMSDEIGNVVVKNSGSKR